MTRKPKTAAADPNPISAALESMAALNPMHETALKAWFEMGAEALKFVSHRMEQDLQTQTAMLGCKCLEDVQKVQAAFYTKAIDDYNSGASRMMELMIAATSQGLGASIPSAKRSYDDVPL